jgi:hypothetical protein
MNYVKSLFTVAVLAALLIPRVGAAFDHPPQACDGTETTGHTTNKQNCAAAATQEQASDLAYYGFDGIPICSPCPEPTEACPQETNYHAEAEERCVMLPATGVWVCCITMPVGTKWDTTCSCE